MPSVVGLVELEILSEHVSAIVPMWTLVDWALLVVQSSDHLMTVQLQQEVVAQVRQVRKVRTVQLGRQVHLDQLVQLETLQSREFPDYLKALRHWQSSLISNGFECCWSLNEIRAHCHLKGECCYFRMHRRRPI